MKTLLIILATVVACVLLFAALCVWLGYLARRRALRARRVAYGLDSMDRAMGNRSPLCPPPKDITRN